jgi:hypothetical protein
MNAGNTYQIEVHQKNCKLILITVSANDSADLVKLWYQQRGAAQLHAYSLTETR